MRGGEPLCIERGRPCAALLLHGWVGNPSEFGKLPAVLDAAGWDVHAPLHPGHGTCPADLVGVRAPQVVDAARGQYDALRARYDRVALVGFSMGGTVATLLAADAPPDALVLIAPFFGVTFRWYHILPPRAWNAALSPLLPFVVSPLPLAAVNRKEGRAGVLTYRAFPRDATRLLRDLRREVWGSDALTRVTSPTLLIYAPGDIAAAPKPVLAAYESIPAERKQMLACERSNHHILHDHDREAAIKAIKEFIA
jgi:carboxylesterase